MPREIDREDPAPPNPPRDLLERWLDLDDSQDLSLAYDAYRAHVDGRDRQMRGVAA
jgi:hypothetical protein